MQATYFRYFPIRNEIDIARVVDVMDGNLYFSSPLDFNDPFEFSANRAMPSSDDVIWSLLETGASPSYLAPSAIDRITRGVKSETRSNLSIRFSETWMRSIGVLCLSTKFDDLLMWAHYGSNHTGVCIGFDSGFSPFRSARRVAYTDARPAIPFRSHVCPDEKLLEDLLFTKSTHWSYESEVRCLSRAIRDDEKRFYSDLISQEPHRADEVAELLATNGGVGKHSFDVKALRCIYFGVRMKPECREQLTGALGDRNLSLRLFQATLEERYFQLAFKKLQRRP